MIIAFMPSGPSESPATLPFRNPEALFAIHQRFEQEWENGQDIGFTRERPKGFPPPFVSRSNFRQWLKRATDDEVLDAQRKWSRKAPELEADLVAMPLPGIGGRDAMQAVLDEPPAPVEGFPRLWREPREAA